jgi:hypothetical protein
MSQPQTAPECHDVEPDYRVKFTDVLTELKYQLATQSLPHPPLRAIPKNKHSILYETIEDLFQTIYPGGDERLWNALRDWYKYHRTCHIVDNNTLNRIKTVIQESSPFIVYGEGLTYQELIAFKLYNIE